MAEDTITRPDVLGSVGSTPLVPLENFSERTDVEVWAKLESANPGGSSKDRSARRMIADALADGRIDRDSTVVESTSGNLGIGLAQACQLLGLSLICVVDSRTDATKIAAIRQLGADVRVISKPDPQTGDLLTARLAAVREIVASTPGAWWPDQYSNESNPAAQAEMMAEIDEALEGKLDWLFVATSTTGTLCGCCDYLLEKGSPTKVVAVDAVGSVLFGGERRIRKLPGLGAGVATSLSQRAWFDRLIRVSDLDCVVGCRRLLASENIFAGASSGGVIVALERLVPLLAQASRCAVILADGGAGYLTSVYDDPWVQRELRCEPDELASIGGRDAAAPASPAP